MEREKFSISKIKTATQIRRSHFDDDHGDNQRDDHGNDHDDDDEDDDYDGNDHNQETPPILLQDHFVWFQGSFVSQINWQPIGKLLFMINLGRLMIQYHDTITQIRKGVQKKLAEVNQLLRVHCGGASPNTIVDW